MMVTLAPIASFAIPPQLTGKMRNLITMDFPSRIGMLVWHVSVAIQEVSTLAYPPRVHPATETPLIMRGCLVQIAPHVIPPTIGMQNIVGRIQAFQMRAAQV